MMPSWSVENNLTIPAEEKAANKALDLRTPEEVIEFLKSRYPQMYFITDNEVPDSFYLLDSTTGNRTPPLPEERYSQADILDIILGVRVRPNGRDVIINPGRGRNQ